MNIDRLTRFFDMTSAAVYAEPSSEPHITITRNVLNGFISDGNLTPESRILDIGCGQGFALEHFASHNIPARGITLGPDVAVCLARGLAVESMDQNDMTFDDASFDFIFARHVLEHSPIPFYTLCEYKRILRPGGVAYIEVPAPGTFARHEFNPNHYSVFPPSSWVSLFEKTGLIPAAEYSTYTIKLDSGTDTYYAFLVCRPTES